MANPASGRSLALSLPPSSLLFETIELPASGTPTPPVNRNLKLRKAGGGATTSQITIITNASLSPENPQTSDTVGYAHAIGDASMGEKNSSSHGIRLKSLFKFFGLSKGKKKEAAAIPKPITHSQAAVATLEACLPRIMNMDRFFEVEGILRTVALPSYQKSAEKDLIAFMDEMGAESNDESYKALGFALKKLVKQSLDLEEKIVLAITAGVTVEFLEQYTDAGALAAGIFSKLQSGEINSETKCPRKLIYLAKLCQKIAQNEDLNLMGWRNLGIIFGPNIFPDLIPRLDIDFGSLQKELNHFAGMLLESWGVNAQTSDETSTFASSSFSTGNIGKFRSSMRHSVLAAMTSSENQFEDHIYDTVADLEDNSGLLGDSDDDSDNEAARMSSIPMPRNEAPIPKPRTAKSLGALAARQTKALEQRVVAKPVFSPTGEENKEEQISFATRRDFFNKR